MSRFWVLLIVISLITIGFAGCTGQAQPQVTVTHQAESKDIILGQWYLFDDTNQTHYSPFEDSYIDANLIEFKGDHTFYYIEKFFIRKAEYTNKTRSAQPGELAIIYATIGNWSGPDKTGMYKLDGNRVERSGDGALLSIDKFTKEAAIFSDYLIVYDLGESNYGRNYYPVSTKPIENQAYAWYNGVNFTPYIVTIPP